MLLVFAANAGRLLVVDDPQPSDVILVLAGETDRRPARAIQLLEQGYARRVVIDVPAEARIFGSTELQLAEKYAQSLPQASAIRICPIEGLSTRDESHDAGKCLARRGRAPDLDCHFGIPHPARAEHFPSRDAGIFVLGGDGSRRCRVRNTLVDASGVGQDLFGRVGEASVVDTFGAVEVSRIACPERKARLES